MEPLWLDKPPPRTYHCHTRLPGSDISSSPDTRQTGGADITYENILYEKDGHVVTITINRPEVHNCLSRATASDLHDAWKTFRDDDDAFAAIMTGAGEKAFSAGWDLKEAAQSTGPGDYDRRRVSLYNSDGPCGYTRRVIIPDRGGRSRESRSVSGWLASLEPDSASACPDAATQL